MNAHSLASCLRVLMSGTVAVVILAGVLPAAAADHSWTGSVNNLWDNAGNWSGGAPLPGDNLAFGAGVLTVTTTNDYPPLTTFGQITISQQNLVPGYTLAGNPIILTNGLSMSGASRSLGAVVALDITLGGANGAEQTFSASRPIAFVGHLELNGHFLNLTNSGYVTIGGQVSDSDGSGYGGIQKMGAGTLALASGARLEKPVNYNAMLGVFGGLLLLDGTATNANQDLTIYAEPNSGTASIQGTGVADNLGALYGGSISPGDGGPGILRCHQADFSYEGTLLAIINGPTPGADYSQLQVSGNSLLAYTSDNPPSLEERTYKEETNVRRWGVGEKESTYVSGLGGY